jgi:sulfide:quinone oxidoreductase
MARTVIIGAGFSGQYAALILHDALRKIGDDHEITMINLYPRFTYVPSLVWVGIGEFAAENAQFDLQPVYDRLGMNLILGRAKEVHPDERYVLVDTDGASRRVDYDYLIIATGPYLNFEATPGLGPEEGYTNSICTPPHATRTASNYKALLERLKQGEKARMVIGTGHGRCTCQGAAFEFISLMHNSLKDHDVRDRVELTWLSNEPRPGDLGIDGFEMQQGPVSFTSEDMVRALFQDYGINLETNSHVHKIDEKTIYTEKVDGSFREIPYDFAMLIPPFEGQRIQYLDKDGNDIKDRMCNPAGFVKVDAAYGKSYDELSSFDWPKTYQSPAYANIYSCGIAFAPPGCMSRPSTTPSGTQLIPAIPRTGYTSELTGKAAALNVAEMIQGREPCHTASLAETPGLCIASLKNSWAHGSAATIGIQPIVRNRAAYPGTGRNANVCSVEIGLAGAWLKKGLHHAFLYKLSAKPMWKYIP